MNFYVYPGICKLGEEPCGMNDGKMIWKDLKTDKGALKRAWRMFPNGFRLFRFTNFYKDSTFKEII